jgi:hypothetical protein
MEKFTLFSFGAAARCRAASQPPTASLVAYNELVRKRPFTARGVAGALVDPRRSRGSALL